jgi:hypothetical protein
MLRKLGRDAVEHGPALALFQRTEATMQLGARLHPLGFGEERERSDAPGDLHSHGARRVRGLPEERHQLVPPEPLPCEDRLTGDEDGHRNLESRGDRLRHFEIVGVAVVESDDDDGPLTRR